MHVQHRPLPISIHYCYCGSAPFQPQRINITSIIRQISQANSFSNSISSFSQSKYNYKFNLKLHQSTSSSKSSLLSPRYKNLFERSSFSTFHTSAANHYKHPYTERAEPAYNRHRSRNQPWSRQFDYSREENLRMSHPNVNGINDFQPVSAVAPMSLTFLGTSAGGGPTASRSCSSLVLDIMGNGELWSTPSIFSPLCI